MDAVDTRGDLEIVMVGYISDTLSCVRTVQEFCDRHCKWNLQRESELEMIRDIMDRAERLNLTADHISKSQKKLKAIGEYVKSKATQVTAESRAQELEKELGSVLQDTLVGLEKMTPFLEAVEKLAVTSLLVFREENPLCQLPMGVRAADVRAVISAARKACPLLIHFQRDDGEFFLPNLVNTDALIFQLDKYVQVCQELCEKLQIRVLTANMKDTSIDLTEEAEQRMVDHLNQLTSIRMDQHFRMAFLFRGAALQFIGLFSRRSSRMREFLGMLEEGATKLDRMKMGANISSVAGSTVGLAGGVVSIVGLALAPVTAGLSLTLTLAGVGLGVTSGINGLATGIAEFSVNSYHGKKVNKVLQCYKEDVGTLLECLEQAASSTEPDVAPGVMDAMMGAGRMGVKILSVSRKIDAIVDGASALTVLKNEGLVTSTARGVAQEGKAARNVPNVASDVSDLGKLAKGTPLALSKTARAGFITLNSIFMGLDLFFICKDSVSLAKGSKSNVSKVIRGRASLWKIELDAWERIQNSLEVDDRMYTGNNRANNMPIEVPWNFSGKRCTGQHTMDIVHTREKLEKLAGTYISDTLSCVRTVQEFCDRHCKWNLQRESELEMIRDIMDRAERLNLTADHIKKSEDKFKAFGEYMKSTFTQVTAESRAQELEKELGSVLQDTLVGLEKMTPFLEAVEKLAVTSLLVFREENPLCQLPMGVRAANVRAVISAARKACPLVMHFQRDDGEFFLPNLANAVVLAFQLDKYVQVAEKLCGKLQKSLYSISSFGLIHRTQKICMKDTCRNLTNEAVQKMFDHLDQLTNIRMDQHFRMAFLFRGAALQFIGLFSQRSSRMREFLEALEEVAVQLDRMKMGASISSVAGSSVGFAGGVVSIIGLALAPVTAGASIALTLVGVGMGVTSGVNSLATGIAELSVNSQQGKKANEIFQSYMEDVETLLDCLEQVACSTEPDVVPGVVDTVKGVVRVAGATAGVGKGLDAIVDCASAVKVLRGEEVVTNAARVAVQEVKAARNLPNVAADLTDFGQLAKGTPLALSKSARAGFIALNSIFMGLDLFFICKDSVSLARGSKSDVSKVIRGRASLWKIELDAWERIQNSLCIGIWRFSKSMKALQTPFY
ncbi:hypothetical protein AGOR_G00227060 [Albula goreensis]|uniref:Uncharacterized protein n=1 Tax=Albula goreensis TaxID=1534307 RepID=A0A8T3CMV8_9TELE|nr:hypothetical protein AGOR_G00227060 [Albula goreensis]